MFKRFVERRAEEALSDTPVVLIVGPRRAGKTTLVKKMGAKFAGHSLAKTTRVVVVGDSERMTKGEVRP